MNDWKNGSSKEIDEIDEMLDLHYSHQNKLDKLSNSNSYQSAREKIGNIFEQEMNELLKRK